MRQIMILISSIAILLLSSCSITVLSVDAPTQMIAGNSVTVKIKVRNTASNPTTEQIRLGVSPDRFPEYSDLELKKISVELEPLSTEIIETTIELPSTMITGDYYLIIISGTNQIVQKIRIWGNDLEGADILPVDFTWADTSPQHILDGPKVIYANEWTEFNVSIRNNTELEANNIQTYCFVSKSQNYDSESLLVGGIIRPLTHSIPSLQEEDFTGMIWIDALANIPEAELGEYKYLFVVTDANNNLAEPDAELNNFLIKAISIKEGKRPSDITQSTDVSFFKGIMTNDSILQSKKQFSSDLTVYPNPISSDAAINVTLGEHIEKSDALLEVYSLDGTLLHQESINGQKQLSLDLGLEMGFYFISINTGNELISKPIIIQ